jgi:acetoin utilization deacetylase AcuC-like enzyme
MTTLLFTHDSSLRHVTPEGHPERVDRIRAVNQILGSEHFRDLTRRAAPAGREEDILRAHVPEHLRRVKAIAPAEGFEFLDADTAMSPGTLEAALHAVGAATAGVDAVFSARPTMSSAPCARRATMPKVDAPWASASSTRPQSPPTTHAPPMVPNALR